MWAHRFRARRRCSEGERKEGVQREVEGGGKGGGEGESARAKLTEFNSQ